MLCRHLGEAQIDINLGQGMSRIENVLGGMDSDIGSQLREQFAFQFTNALLGVEDERLVFFQVGRDVAFAVGKRLFANIVLGHTVEIGVGDLDIVAGALL